VTDMLARLNLPGSLIALRRATPDDLPAIVGLLADDPLGRTREAVTAADGFGPYERAFAAATPPPMPRALSCPAGTSSGSASTNPANRPVASWTCSPH
jgi:hypothetical protein